jgi:hypothetical protein
MMVRHSIPPRTGNLASVAADPVDQMGRRPMAAALSALSIPHDPAAVAEALGRADLLEVGADVGAGDRAGRLGGCRVGHDPDDRAEALAVQRMARLAEVDRRAPAERVPLGQHVGDRVDVDAANVAQISFAGAA